MIYYAPILNAELPDIHIRTNISLRKKQQYFHVSHQKKTH